MRVFITLIFVFFSHLFVNVAQAAPHTNAEKKASASTDDKHLKKNQTAKNCLVFYFQAPVAKSLYVACICMRTMLRYKLVNKLAQACPAIRECH